MSAAVKFDYAKKYFRSKFNQFLTSQIFCHSMERNTFIHFKFILNLEKFSSSTKTSEQQQKISEFKFGLKVFQSHAKLDLWPTVFTSLVTRK